MLDELELEEEIVPKDFKKRCFIEELCTCELKEYEQALGQAHKHMALKRLHTFDLGNKKTSASVKVVPGEFSKMLAAQAEAAEHAAEGHDSSKAGEFKNPMA